MLRFHHFDELTCSLCSAFLLLQESDPSVTGVIIKEGDCCQSVQPDLVPEGAQVTPKDIGG
jgi:hypothetical protein